jgi:hypothetical protein
VLGLRRSTAETGRGLVWGLVPSSPVRRVTLSLSAAYGSARRSVTAHADDPTRLNDVEAATRLASPGRSRRVADGVCDAIRYAGSTALRGVVVWSGTGAGRERGESFAIARSRHGSVHGAHGSRRAAGRDEVRGTSFDVLSVPYRDVGGSARRRKDLQIGSAEGAGRARNRQVASGHTARGAWPAIFTLVSNIDMGTSFRVG